MPETPAISGVPTLDPEAPAPEGSQNAAEGQAEGGGTQEGENREIPPKVLESLKTLSEEDLMALKRIPDKQGYMADQDRKIEQQRQEIKRQADQLRVSEQIPRQQSQNLPTDQGDMGLQQNATGEYLKNGQKWVDDMSADPTKAIQGLAKQIREEVMQSVKQGMSGISDTVATELAADRQSQEVERRWGEATQHLSPEQQNIAYDLLQVQRKQGWYPTPEQAAFEAQFGSPSQAAETMQTLYNHIQVLESQSGQPAGAVNKHPMGAGFSNNNQPPPTAPGIPAQGQTGNGLVSFTDYLR